MPPWKACIPKKEIGVTCHEFVANQVQLASFGCYDIYSLGSMRKDQRGRLLSYT